MGRPAGPDPPPAPEVAVRVAPEATGRSLDSYQPGENGFVFGPQGGLRASINDLDAIGHLLARRGAPILKAETFAAMIRTDLALRSGPTERRRLWRR